MFKEFAIKYFNAFSNKDISTIEAMFSNNVSLRDWNFFAEGIRDVIFANSVIFDTADNIAINLVNIFCDGKFVIAELIINIDSDEPIQVVDILEFTDDSKICSIRAYKG
jgi:hypothetical protein